MASTEDAVDAEISSKETQAADIVKSKKLKKIQINLNGSMVLFDAVMKILTWVF